MKGVERYRLSFWDAMVWGIAVQHHVAEVLSEDGPVGATLEGVRYRNPLAT
ncbi:MAG: hypothetical protein AB2A00_40825 [Myxococcota bacterium]